MYKIQYGIPLPARRHTTQAGVRRKYPLEDMRVGGVVFAPHAGLRSMVSYISRASKELPGKFNVRAVTIRPAGDDSWELCAPTDEGAVSGVGIWRIE